MNILIYLIGYMGAGKSTIGKQLADKLQLNFIDMDRFIETTHGTSITDLFLDNGEAYFRLLEHRYLEKLSTYHHTVVACGGGTPCFHNNIQLMLKTGLVIYIKQPVEVLYKRLAEEQSQRPLLMGLDESQLKSFILENVTKRELFYNQSQIIYEPEHTSADDLITSINLFYKGT